MYSRSNLAAWWLAFRNAKVACAWPAKVSTKVKVEESCKSGLPRSGSECAKFGWTWWWGIKLHASRTKHMKHCVIHCIVKHHIAWYQDGRAEGRMEGRKLQHEALLPPRWRNVCPDDKEDCKDQNLSPTKQPGINAKTVQHKAMKWTALILPYVFEKNACLRKGLCANMQPSELPRLASASTMHPQSQMTTSLLERWGKNNANTQTVSPPFYHPIVHLRLFQGS